MAKQRGDMASKWLLHNQGKGALLVGGLKGVRRYQPMPGEIVQNRRYPDGLLQVFLGNEPKPHHALVEIATYPEKRALKQALDDLTIAYTALNHLPELLMLILRPKGKFRIEGKHEVRSKLGLARLVAEWKAVELWTLSAEQFLAEGDVGATPWITLMDFKGPPETLLERCAEKIEREAHPKDQADLLAVSQVLTEIRFPEPELVRLLGGHEPVIESPMLVKMRAEAVQQATLALLRARFGTIPREVTKRFQSILDEKKLTALTVLAGQCANLEEFREALLS
jgi:hypothetical protein